MIAVWLRRLFWCESIEWTRFSKQANFRRKRGSGRAVRKPLSWPKQRVIQCGNWEWTGRNICKKQFQRMDGIWNPFNVREESKEERGVRVEFNNI